jgi:hypothetical protein
MFVLAWGERRRRVPLRQRSHLRVVPIQPLLSECHSFVVTRWTEAVGNCAGRLTVFSASENAGEAVGMPPLVPRAELPSPP